MRKVTICLMAALFFVALAGLDYTSYRVHSTGYEAPENMAFDGNGWLYVSDTDNLWKVGADGEMTEVYAREEGEDGVSLGGVSMGPGGVVYFSVGNAIKTYDPRTGGVEVFVEGFDFANGNCFDDFGNFYIADSNAKSLYVVPAGTREAEYLKEKAGWVNGLVWSRRDNALYFTISSPGRVGMFRLGAGPIIIEELTLGRFPVYGLDDLTIDDDGNIYVCAWMNSKVVKVSPGRKKETVIDGIDGPSSIAFGLGPDNHKLYIAIKGGSFKFGGEDLIEVEIEAEGYRLPFVEGKKD